jgi:hypothetical protein
VTPKRGNACRLFGKDPYPWSQTTLLDVLATLVLEGGKTAKLCFFIDGLDNLREASRITKI